MGSFVPIWCGILVSWNSKEKAISAQPLVAFLRRLGVRSWRNTLNGLQKKDY